MDPIAFEVLVIVYCGIHTETSNVPGEERVFLLVDL
jgi:hypothetical protein